MHGLAKVLGWAADEHCQTVLVECSHKSKNEHPHVTLSTDGTPAVYSNELLAKGVTLVDGPTLVGTVDIRRD